jgi:predicted Zn-dependent protease
LAALIPLGCATSSDQTTLTTLQSGKAAGTIDPFASPPEMLNTGVLVPVDPDDPRAWLSLDGALLTIDDPVIPRPIQTRDSAPSDQQRLRALRLYARGKASRIEGDYQSAIEALLECVQVDPQFPEPWHELALAHREAGDRLASSAAFRNVLASNPDDLLSLTLLGIDSLHRRDFATAASYLAHAWSLRSTIDSSVHAYIIAIQLGQAMRQMGYLTAALEAFDNAELSQRVVPPPYLEAELNALLNSQAELWRDRGDIAMRLRRHSDAADAYARAAALPSFNPDELLARRVASLALDGQGVLAATTLLETLHANNGQTTQTQLSLARYLSANQTLARALRNSLDELEASLEPDQRQLVETDLLLARCATLTPAEARDQLRDYLLSSPHDERIVDALYDMLSSMSSTEARRTTLSLISNTPFKFHSFTQSLVTRYPDIDEHLEGLLPPRSRSIERTLLTSQLLLLRSRDDQASTILQETISQLGTRPPLMIAQAEIELRSGDTDAVLRTLGALESDTRQGALARAWILRALGDYDTAFAQLTEIIDETADTPASPEELMMAAQLCVAREQYQQAEDLLARTIESYPRFEQAHAELIGLYSQDGVLRDQEKFSQAIIALRRISPSSKTVRWLRAQELLRSGQYNRAEQELLSLAGERLSRPVVDLLVTLWLRTGSAQRAEQWLGEQRQRFPSDPHFVAKLAEVYAQSDRAQQSASLLEEWLERRPAEISISRQLENLYRTTLNNHARANELARLRLDRAPLSPQRSLELASLHRADEQFREALRELRDLVMSHPALTDSQRELLYRESLILGEASRQGVFNDATALAGYYKTLFSWFEDIPPDLIRYQMFLLQQNDANVDEFLDALDRAHELQPETASELYDAIAGWFYGSQQFEQAARVASQGIRRVDTPSLTLVSLHLESSRVGLDLEEMILAIETAHRMSYSRQLPTAPQQPDPNVSLDDDATSELAYNAAVWFASSGRADQSHRLYRIALEHNPSHAMANNNLGYSMTELDMSLDEAHRLILRAYSIDSTSGSVTDSLGWVRYKLGMLDDTLDEQGAIVEEGAITLLQRAATMDDARNDPIVHDHLGDALWANGQHDEARKHWTTAASFLDTQPRLNPANAIPPQIYLQQESDKLREAVRTKLDAIENDLEPPVAPTAANRDHDPSGL